MLISLLEKVNNLNEMFFAPIDNLISKIPTTDWALDAIIDSVHLIPFLFIVFLAIEIIEFFYAGKINTLLREKGKKDVAIGSLAALFPQCGVSVIASSLYVKRIITRGTLIAVYLTTSDETIPILLATPEKAYLLIPIVGIKIFIGILMGYLIDLVIAPKYNHASNLENSNNINDIIEEGCCKHDITNENKHELFIHPIMHTINVWFFILLITLILNYCLTNVTITDFISGSTYMQPIIATFVGLIPNCAISVGITMMLIKGTITFGAAMSGLLANAGLGLLVLLKNNDLKDTFKIILMLIVISIISGIVINYFV